MSTSPTIIAQIVNGAETVWTNIETWIDAAAAKVKAALPASAIPNLTATVSDLKQTASDALGLANAGLTGGEPALVAGIEAALDGALAAATNGASVPFVPIVNQGLTNLASLATSTVSAWLLKNQAALAPAAPAPGVTVTN